MNIMAVMCQMGGIVMSDRTLKIILRAATGVLLLSIIFCVTAIVLSQSQQSEMEQQRVDNETEIANMQMPEFSSKDNEDTENNESGEKKDNPQEIIVPEPDEKTGTGSAAGQSAPTSEKKVIVLDAGHGKSSSAMTKEEKLAEGYKYNESKGSWGEWRHYKNGTFGEDCHGSGCTMTAPPNGSCWYTMVSADRDTEPAINLNNALAAKKYLEQMGYEVRMTRTSSEQNPSMNKRVSYCFPNNDDEKSPDAAAYICIHSNAGGGRGTSYIALEDTYKQKFIPSDYNSKSNSMGKTINSKIAEASGLSANGAIGNEGYLILFNKCPVPIAYLEIGFFDSKSDLAILQSKSDSIGKAIAEGVDEYLKGN